MLGTWGATPGAARHRGKRRDFPAVCLDPALWEAKMRGMRTHPSSLKAVLRQHMLLLGLSLPLLFGACQSGAQDVADLGTVDVPDAADPPDLSVAADLGTVGPDLASPGGMDGGSTDDCPAAAGKMGRDLLTALYNCVRGHTSLGYDSGRDAMFLMFSDPANNYSVECIYTGRKAAMVKDRASANAAMMNTEHSWPQSIGAAGVAKSDLHHLFPTDNTANGKRGNYPFGEVKTATWTGPDPDGKGPSKLGTNADGKTVFEVRDAYKGNIARALLYFYTRYAAEPPSGFSTTNLQIEEPLLHKWHQMDPPDAAERRHNDEVFKLQKNRNPYIDHPEYVEKVGDFLKTAP